MPECSSWRVECDGQMAWLLFFDQFKDVFGESEEDGHVCALGIYHRMPQKCIVHLEDKGMSVYQKKSLVHIDKIEPQRYKKFRGVSKIFEISYKVLFLHLN